MKRVRNILSNPKGAMAVEYALLIGLIAFIIVAALTNIGTDVGNTFNELESNM